MSTRQDTYVVVTGDIAQNNIVFSANVLNSMFIIRGRHRDNSNYKACIATTLSKEEIVENHKSVLYSIGLSTKGDDFDLPCMYWISKLYKNPCKQRYKAGSAKCTTKTLSKLLTSILTAVIGSPVQPRHLLLP